jgi:transposase
LAGQGGTVPDAPTYEQLLAHVVELERVIVAQADRIAELERKVGADSSNSSRPPSSDAPWAKKPAPKRSLRTRSGRKAGKQPGAGSVSRRLVDDPDETFEVAPDRCGGCGESLDGALEVARVRRQVADVSPPPPSKVTEYQLVSRQCRGCGRHNAPAPGDRPRRVSPAAARAATRAPAPSADGTAGPGSALVPVPGSGLERAEAVDHDLVDLVLPWVLAPGSPVRIGPAATAVAALLTCGHYLPVGRAAALFKALTGMAVSTGYLAGVRRRAAARLETGFLAHMRALLATAPVLHADETTGRAAGELSWVHVACTEYLTLMHVGGRSADDIDAGGVLKEFTGTLMRDGYAGYTHLPAVHAWCAAHLVRDLRAVSDADPQTQIWAIAMANTLTEANAAAVAARATGADRLPDETLKQIRNHYRGAIAKGNTDNRTKPGALAAEARKLLRRFTRYEDMILRFATDLSVPFTNNVAERAVRPVKVQQRTSGGAWRTLEGLTNFATVQSYLDTTTKWGIDKHHALQQLFTTGAWLPPALTPS